MPGAPGQPGSRGLPLEVLQNLRTLIQTLEAALPSLERANYWSGRRLWHAERRFREDRVQERWQLQQTLDAAQGLHDVVVDIGVAVAGAIRIGDEIFSYQSRAQQRGFVTDRGSGAGLCYDPLGNDVSTQTPYLWPEGLGGFRSPPTHLLPETGASSSGVRLVTPVSRVEYFPISIGSQSSEAEEINDDFWNHDGHDSTNSTLELSSPR